MAGASSLFFCTGCGHEAGKWLGQCPACGAWNSLAEQPSRRGDNASAPSRRGASPISVSEAVADAGERLVSGLEGIDRVLGGGLVPGSLILHAGEPGIGKSTLLLQLAAALAAPGQPAVYVSGEESARQVALRARRIDAVTPELLLLPETSCEAVVALGFARVALPARDASSKLALPSVPVARVSDLAGVLA